MKLVMIESPFRAITPLERIRNDEYLKLCVFDSMKRGEAPFASHGFYTQYLKDSEPAERKLGIRLGFCWARKAEIRAFYVDLGTSEGMKTGLSNAMNNNQELDIRNLPHETMKSFNEGFPEE